MRYFRPQFREKQAFNYYTGVAGGAAGAFAGNKLGDYLAGKFGLKDSDTTGARLGRFGLKALGTVGGAFGGYMLGHTNFGGNMTAKEINLNDANKKVTDKLRGYVQSERDLARRNALADYKAMIRGRENLYSEKDKADYLLRHGRRLFSKAEIQAKQDQLRHQIWKEMGADYNKPSTGLSGFVSRTGERAKPYLGLMGDALGPVMVLSSLPPALAALKGFARGDFTGERAAVEQQFALQQKQLEKQQKDYQKAYAAMMQDNAYNGMY